MQSGTMIVEVIDVGRQGEISDQQFVREETSSGNGMRDWSFGFEQKKLESLVMQPLTSEGDRMENDLEVAKRQSPQPSPALCFRSRPVGWQLLLQGFRGGKRGALSVSVPCHGSIGPCHGLYWSLPWPYWSLIGYWSEVRPNNARHKKGIHSPRAICTRTAGRF